MTDNEDILVNGLVLIRQGILSGNTSLVCEGYNLISDDNVVWPQLSENKTDRIRQKLKEKIDNQVEKTTKQKKNSKRKLAEDDEDGDIVDKYKVSPAKIMQSGPIKEDDIVHVIDVKKQKGGKRFGHGQILVITDAVDPAEQEINQKKKPNRSPAPPRTKVFKGSDNFNYNHNANKRPPNK